MSAPVKDFTDQQFGNLTARWPTGRWRRHVVWLCSCTCGSLLAVPGNNLTSGNTQSCGCLRETPRFSTRFPREYSSWGNMKQRCTNPKAVNWKHYGGAGVLVCERWSDFKNFLEDMGERPAGTTLGRLGDSGNYEPGNCSWQTIGEQRRIQGEKRRLPST